jgi:lipoprotein-anchoring transpeptidase ErfK/SrfK
MYWYYKYPLLLILAALTGWVVSWGWHRSEPPAGQRKESPQKIVAARPNGDKAAVTTQAKASATPVVKAPVQQPPKAAAAPAAADSGAQEIGKTLKLAEENLAKGNLAMARGIAESVILLPAVKPLGAEWLHAADIIGKVNIILAGTTAPAVEKIRYKVLPGDTLIGVARKHQVTVESIAKANRLDMANPVIHSGMILSVYPAKWTIEVYKSHFLLVVRNGDRLFKCYRVGIGRENRTPVGEFSVATRLREPEWSPPGRQPVPYGKPENILGTRWLGLLPVGKTDPTLTGFGIHGTWQPETVGTAASEGCVRMKNEEVDELFDLIPNGTQVTIKDE